MGLSFTVSNGDDGAASVFVTVAADVLLSAGGLDTSTVTGTSTITVFDASGGGGIGHCPLWHDGQPPDPPKSPSGPAFTADVINHATSDTASRIDLMILLLLR
jgi:hypothetical protein